jgi:hypothetical protein
MLTTRPRQDLADGLAEIRSIEPKRFDLMMNPGDRAVL